MLMAVFSLIWLPTTEFNVAIEITTIQYFQNTFQDSVVRYIDE